MTTERERVGVAPAGARADRLPAAFWRRRPGDDQDAARYDQDVAEGAP